MQRPCDLTRNSDSNLSAPVFSTYNLQLQGHIMVSKAAVAQAMLYKTSRKSNITLLLAYHWPKLVI